MDIEKVYSDYPTTVVRSRAEGHSIIHKFGRNNNTNTALQDIWNVESVYTFPTSAFPVVAVSSSTTDTVAGAGARVITIEGLDGGFNAVTEDINMNGQSNTVATSASYIRINRAYVKETGFYANAQSGSNNGDITIQFSGSTIMSRISDGVPAIGQSQQTHFTVPVGKIAYIQAVTANVDSAKTATVYAWQRPNAHIVTAPFSARRNLFTLNGVSGVNPLPIEFPMGAFHAKTDIWFSATAGVANTGVEIDYEILLIDTP